MKKRIVFIIATVILISALTVAVSAAAAADLAMVVGRGTVLVSNGLVTKLEPLSDGKEVKDMFCVPVVIEESTYIPFRYVFEKMGITVSYDSTTKTTVLTRKNGRIGIYDNGIKSGECAEIRLNGDCITFYYFNGSSSTENINAYKYLGMTYIPARYLEKFGALIKWDSTNSVVYISYENSDSFEKKFLRISAITDPQEKQSAIDSHFATITETTAFKEAMSKYLATNIESSNNQNGGLVQPYNGKNYYPNINIAKSGWFTKVGDNARQVCYASDGVNNYIYFVDRNSQTLKRYCIGGDKNGQEESVALSPALAGKKITNITYSDGNLFYVAYDNAAVGGNLYMSLVGNEAHSTVKVTKDNTWNYYISPAHKIYYVNFGEGYRLTTVDMRAMSNIEVFVNTPFEGVLGNIVNFTPMQSFAFDCVNATDYYYVDIVNGDLIRSSRNHNTAAEILKKGEPGVLRSFLNVGSFGGKNCVLYVEYKNGKYGNLDNCKIVRFDLESKTATTVYESKFAINGLCLYGGKIYFTDLNYSKLYELSGNTGSDYKLSVIGQ